MSTRVIVLSFQEIDSRYGLGRAELTEFVDLGLLRFAPAPDTVEVDDPDELLPRLARLHHGLGLAPEAVDLVLLMRQRLVALQASLTREVSRARQLEAFLHGGPLLGE